jgi:predicted DNA-binding protein (MmcQ/YjbR family)
LRNDPLDRLRTICLALPEAVEQLTWETTITFRVRGKIFAMHNAGAEGHTLTCKAPPGMQEMLVGADPERFFVPAYVGHNGWVGERLDGDSDWDEVADLIAESYRMTAPKRLTALLR